MKKNIKEFYRYTALTLAALTSPAYPQSTLSDASQKGADVPARSTDDGVVDIIVTAQRRSENLQSTALAISAVSSDTLQQRGVTSVTEISKLVPSIKIGSLAGSSTQVTIRGVGNAGGNAFADAGVGINLDGVYLARPTGASGIFYDIDRVEVLKGPQGTLYGRNSTGGVVNVISKDPGKMLGMEFTGELGNADHIRASGAVNIPISDTLAVRVAAQSVYSNGFTPDGAGSENSEAARIKIKYTPTSALSILLEADYAKNEEGPLLGGYAYPGFNFFSSIGCGPTSLQNKLNPAIAKGVAPPTNCDTRNNNSSAGFSGTVNYDFGPVTATFVLADRRTMQDYLHYAAGFPVGDDNHANPGEYKTAELRLALKEAGPLKLQVGGFYFDESSRSTLEFNQGVTYQRSNLDFGTKSYSGFGEASLSLARMVRITVGGRYTSDKKDVSGFTISPVGSNGVIAGSATNPATPLGGFVLGTCPAALGAIYTPGTTQGPFNSTFSFPNGTCQLPVQGQQTFSRFTYRGGVETDLGPQNLAYAQIATGFRSGGFSAFPDAPDNHNYYQPETLTAYTAGLKNRFFGSRLQVNLEGFYYAYKNKQLSHLGAANPPGAFNNRVDNAGKAMIYGAELEMIARPTRHDTVNLDVQYEHTRYDGFRYVSQYNSNGNPVARPPTTCPFTNIAPIPQTPFNTALVDCSGRPVSYAPELVITAGYRHVFDLKSGSSITFGVNTQYQTSYWLAEDYIPSEKQGSTISTDSTLSWTTADEKLTLTAYVNNIENETIGVASFLASGGARIIVRPPRTFGARFNVRI